MILRYNLRSYWNIDPFVPPTFHAIDQNMFQPSVLLTPLAWLPRQYLRVFVPKQKIWCAAFTACDTGTSFPAALDAHGTYLYD